jgi:murein DD-endopeptidase MepM/ murein hydrolase activator NlpD
MIKDIFGSVFSQKILGKNNELSKVKSEKESLEIEASLKIIAKLGLSFKTLAQEFKKISNGFIKLLKLEGIKPSQPINFSKEGSSAGANRQLFVNIPKKKNERGEEEDFFSFGSIVTLIFSLLAFSIGSVIIGLSKLGDVIGESFASIKIQAIDFWAGAAEGFEKINWTAAFKKVSDVFFEFLSTKGIVEKETVVGFFSNISNIPSVVVEYIRSFLIAAKDSLVVNTKSFASWLALDVLGVDVKEVETRSNKKARDEYINSLATEGVKLQDEIGVLKKVKDTSIKRNVDWTKKLKDLIDNPPKLEEGTSEQKKTKSNKKVDEDVDPVLDKTSKDLPTKPDGKLSPTGVMEPEIKKEVPVRIPSTPETKSTNPKDFGESDNAYGGQKSTPITKEDAQNEKTNKIEKDKGSGDDGVKYSTTEGQAVVTSLYGMRMHPVKKQLKPHTGIDYAGVPVNSPIQILSNAEVLDASDRTGYGNMIDLKVNGEVLRFAHLNKMFVKKGDKIEEGTIIGLLGNTGVGTGPHLHFEHRTKSSFQDYLTTTYDPLKTGAPSLIAIGDKPVRLVADQKYKGFQGSFDGSKLNSESSSISAGYREQMKQGNPAIINYEKVNNTQVISKTA